MERTEHKDGNVESNAVCKSAHVNMIGMKTLCSRLAVVHSKCGK